MRASCPQLLLCDAASEVMNRSSQEAIGTEVSTSVALFAFIEDLDPKPFLKNDPRILKLKQIEMLQLTLLPCSPSNHLLRASDTVCNLDLTSP